MRQQSSTELPSVPSASSIIPVEAGRVPSTVLASSPEPALLIDNALVQVWVPRLSDVEDSDETLSLRPPTASVWLPIKNILALLEEYPEQREKLTNSITEVNTEIIAKHAEVSAQQTTPKRKRIDEDEPATKQSTKRTKRSKYERTALSVLGVRTMPNKYGFSVIDMKNAGLSGDILHKRAFSGGRVKYYTQGGKHRVGGPKPDDIIELVDGRLEISDPERTMNSSGYSKWLTAKIEEYNAGIENSNLEENAENISLQAEGQATGSASQQTAGQVENEGEGSSANIIPALNQNRVGMSLPDTPMSISPGVNDNQGTQLTVNDGQPIHAGLSERIDAPISSPNTVEQQTSNGISHTLPATPRRTWGIGALVSTIPRSVSKYMPGFRRALIPDFNAPVATPRTIAMQSTSTSMEPSTTEATSQATLAEPEPMLITNIQAADAGSATPTPTTPPAQTNAESPVEPRIIPQTMTQDNTIVTPARKRTVDGQMKTELSASQQAFIDEEVRRRVQVAMVIHEATERSTAISAKPRRLKKRASRTPSPIRIPNPPNCSYGMDLDYFPYDSSESESEHEIEQGPPTKRARTSTITQSPIAREPLRGNSLARPYMGTTFADGSPVSTPFTDTRKTVDDTVVHSTSPEAFKDIAERERNYAGHFEVPYSSESEDEAVQAASPSKKPAKKTVHFAMDPTEQPPSAMKQPVAEQATPEQSAMNQPPSNRNLSNQTHDKLNSMNEPSQSPPPAPVPAHAELPPVSIEASLARAKAEATRYTPSKPSGLRAATRLSSSTVASEADVEGNDEGGFTSMASPKDNGGLDKTGSNEDSNDSEGLTSEEESGANLVRDDELGLDPEVSRLVYSLPESDLRPVAFPSTGDEHHNLDPVVAAALNATWGPEDESTAHEVFRFGLAEFKAKEALV